MSVGELLQSEQDSDKRCNQTEHNEKREKSGEKQSESRWGKANSTGDHSRQRNPPKRFEKCTLRIVLLEQVLMEITDKQNYSNVLSR